MPFYFINFRSLVHTANTLKIAFNKSTLYLFKKNISSFIKCAFTTFFDIKLFFRKSLVSNVKELRYGCKRKLNIKRRLCVTKNSKKLFYEIR